MAIHIALALALIGSLALALVLWRWAERVAGTRQLTLFLVGVAVWIVGNELPTWFGPGAERAGLSLLATAALTSAVFFHFAAAFTRTPAGRWIGGAYALGIAAMALSILLVPGRYESFAGLDHVAVPNAVGWCTSLVWAGLAGAGQVLLLRALMTWKGLAWRQLAAVTASSAWGLLCMSGYAIVALDLPMAPWPLLGLPIYPVLLVYGILRYELLLANAWARRALGWAILVGTAGLIVAAVPLLPFGTNLGTRFATAAEVGIAFLVLGGPARRLAERIVYPGGGVTAEDLAFWRTHLGQAADTAELASRAAFLLSRRLSIDVDVVVGDDAGIPAGPAPLLTCRKGGSGWNSTLESGWGAAPPGQLRVAEMLGAVLTEEARRLERAAALARQERQMQAQARLAELGALAATVAHDVRNPLNIIAMAVATADAATRAEVRDQIQRIARLADELLDYARPWSVAAVPVNIASLARDLASHHPIVEIRIPDDLQVLADPGRAAQAIGNLIDNACAVARQVVIEAESGDGRVRLHVCDDGPGIPSDLRDRVFEPFVSRSPGGTGLGLAIVARIAAASGGSIALTERAGWSTCFTLSLPQAAMVASP
jgi:signal transduction histidine kinase